MRKQVLFAGLAMIFLVATTTRLFSSENQKHKQTKNLRLGSFPVQGYWPISNFSTPNADVLTSPFGPRYFSKQPTPNDFYDFHDGIDISAAKFRSVHAAFDGTILQVVANSNNNTASSVILQHIDPFDNSIFFTRYLHLNYTDALRDLAQIAGPNSPVIDAPIAPQSYRDPNTGLLHTINPFAESGDSGGVPAHLHFEGMVGGTNSATNAINPMREDSLPYTNSGGPTIQNIVLTTTPKRLTFRVNTHHQELDLNGIFLLDSNGDDIEIDFDNRKNIDGSTSNQDGIIVATTSFQQQLTITITTFDFNPGTNQMMDFAFDLPATWGLNPIILHANDTQEFFDQETIFPTSVEDKVTNTLPLTYSLFQNFPNPFNPSTTIRFALPKRSIVSLMIYDMRGSLMRELAVQNFYDAGWGELVWDGTNATGLPVASGAYFYRLNAESLDSKKKFLQTKKLLLVR